MANSLPVARGDKLIANDGNTTHHILGIFPECGIRHNAMLINKVSGLFWIPGIVVFELLRYGHVQVQVFSRPFRIQHYD